MFEDLVKLYLAKMAEDMEKEEKEVKDKSDEKADETAPDPVTNEEEAAGTLADAILLLEDLESSSEDALASADILKEYLGSVFEYLCNKTEYAKKEAKGCSGKCCEKKKKDGDGKAKVRAPKHCKALALIYLLSHPSCTDEVIDALAYEFIDHIYSTEYRMNMIQRLPDDLVETIKSVLE